MRTTWNGAISFGLVTIPIGLAIATEPRAKASDVTFRTLHRECGTPIKQKRWCPVHDREVGPDELVKGWEVAKGQYVMIEDDGAGGDRGRHARRRSTSSGSSSSRRSTRSTSTAPTTSRPSSQPAARRPYVLLLAAMRETNMAALGRFVLRGSEKICLIRPYGEALALETLFLAEDIRSKAEIEEAVEGVEVKDAELDLARADHREPRRAVRAGLAREPLPPQPPRAARGEAKRRADPGAAAGARGDAVGRPARGAAGLDRRGEEAGHEEARAEGTGCRLRRRARRRTATGALSACSCAWNRNLSILPW